MIPERGVSYYGVAYPDRAARDYAEMVEHGCNAMLLAVSEFDWWFWRKNVVRLIDAAKDNGLTAYVDLWGWGKTLAGEPPSLFLMMSLDGRQRAASGKTYHATCLNYAPFREHLRSSVAEVITETSVDGLFWDEPHYANWHDPDWACTCPICGALYRELHGEDMPRELTPEVVGFREDRAVGFLRELSEHVKETDPKVDVTCCLLPTKSPLIGITDWEKVAAIPELDTLATDPYYFHTDMDRERGLRFFRETSADCLDLAKKHGKRSQLWLMAFKVPAGREGELTEVADIAAELGADSLFAWPYRGGEGSVLASGDPGRVWGTIGEAYRRHAS
ncbi:MAG TPA: hypothetical protein VGB32_07680 [Candidatus Bathyarchaeia archaeon]